MKFILAPPWRQSLFLARESISAFAGKYFWLMGLWQVVHACGFHGAQGLARRAINAPKIRFRVGKRQSFPHAFLRHFDFLIGGYPLKISLGNQYIPRSEASIMSFSSFCDRQLDPCFFNTAWRFIALPIVAPAIRLLELDKGLTLLANNQLN